MYKASAIDPNIMNEDLMGRSFISLPSEFRTMNKDAPVDREHPLLRVLLLQMRRLRIRRYGAQHHDCRAKRVCNGA